MEKNFTNATRTMAKLVKTFKDYPGCLNIAKQVARTATTSLLDQLLGAASLSSPPVADPGSRRKPKIQSLLGNMTLYPILTLTLTLDNVCSNRQLHPHPTSHLNPHPHRNPDSRPSPHLKSDPHLATHQPLAPPTLPNSIIRCAAIPSSASSPSAPLSNTPSNIR